MPELQGETNSGMRLGNVGAAFEGVKRWGVAVAFLRVFLSASARLFLLLLLHLDSKI